MRQSTVAFWTNSMHFLREGELESCFRYAAWLLLGLDVQMDGVRRMPHFCGKMASSSTSSQTLRRPTHERVSTVEPSMANSCWLLRLEVAGTPGVRLRGVLSPELVACIAVANGKTHVTSTASAPQPPQPSQPQQPKSFSLKGAHILVFFREHMELPACVIDVGSAHSAAM